MGGCRAYVRVSGDAQFEPQLRPSRRGEGEPDPWRDPSVRGCALCREVSAVAVGWLISSFQVPHFFNVGPSYLFPNCFRTGTVVFPLPSSPPPSLVVGHTTLNIVV